MSTPTQIKVGDFVKDVVACRCGHPGARVECTAGLLAF
jgi:hypothetical protein